MIQNNDEANKLIESLERVAVRQGLTVRNISDTTRYPLLAMHRRGPSSAKSIYLSAGMHGDEPAGPLALLELLRDGLLPEHFDYWICPLLNPSGFGAVQRENREGLDLNRDYEALKSTEVRAHTKWIHETIENIDIGLHLHEDWESQGFYLYAEHAAGESSYSKAILEAVRPHMPIDLAPKIDGWPASEGLIKVSDLPQGLVGIAESGFLRKHFNSQNYTLEAASSMPLEQRITALKTAVRTVFTHFS